eukprot:Seg847.7 transcript_id=Seg847.7/GoldUCD/mRNA.D3Y31 product="RNA-binding protein 14" protein_id=Seg847.7/GoldUCD/D3Y31
MATKLYVANLPLDCSETELHGMFSLCGPVSELDIIKNYAFVHMATNEGAQKAVADYNGRNLRGGIISVQFSKIQNVNRGNKFTVKYDRPDRIGRGGFNNRGGFYGGRGEMRGGFGFRGRGGFHGGRGGPGSFHRGKPYDRNQFSQMSPQMNLSNLQPVRQVGAEAVTVANQIQVAGSQVPANIRQVQPQQAQQQFLTQSINRVTMQTQIRMGQVPGVPTQVAAVPGNIAVVGQSPMHPTQQVLQQPMQGYPGSIQQNQPVPQQIPGSIQQQQIITPGGMMQQRPGNPQPSMQATAIPAGMAQPAPQQQALTPQQSMNSQTPSNQVQGYTVYERYVDYRNPAEAAQIQSSQYGAQVGPGTVTQVYQQVPQAASKDPYANAQMMYERHAGATSRAAVYANAYYGGNPNGAVVTPGTAVMVQPAGNMVQQVPVAAAGAVMQPVQFHFQQ